LILTPPPANDVELPKPVRRKNFMFLIAFNIDLIADGGTPNAWNTNNAIA
jgi:hypothetical protein